MPGAAALSASSRTGNGGRSRPWRAARASFRAGLVGLAGLLGQHSCHCRGWAGQETDWSLSRTTAGHGREQLLWRDWESAGAQLVGDPFGERLRVFISHTKRHPVEEEPDYVDELVGRVRTAIADTHLQAYLDAADLQPGADWEHELRSQAASSALLAVRTDLYASREWCQREFLVAKRAGMPIVTLNGVCRAEERGSFLMDHVPAVGYRQADEGLRQSSVEEALNLLVDAALTRALWGLQQEMLEQLGFDWTPLHAPEPVTVLPWLLQNRQRATDEGPLLIMHPDPPLGPEETRVLSELFEVAGVRDAVDIVTPRTYMSRATRGH